MFRRVGSIAMITLFLLASGSPASASCIGYRDPDAEFRKALRTFEVVFVGEVVATSHANRTAEVAVLEVWRGPAMPSVVIVRGSEITDPNMRSSVDRYFTEGERLIFLPSGHASPFNDSACSFTRPYTPGLARLRPPGATVSSPPPQPDQVEPRTESASGWVPVTGVAGGILALTILAVAFRSRAVRNAASSSGR